MNIRLFLGLDIEPLIRLHCSYSLRSSGVARDVENTTSRTVAQFAAAEYQSSTTT